jgi:hypothetical protein
VNDIKVRKADLIGAMKANRETHRAGFEEAMVGFRGAFMSKLDKMIEDAMHNYKYAQAVGLMMPEDHSSDYDRVIQMLEMDVEEVIELSETEFAQYVQDDWGWKKQWTTTNSYYNSSR